MAEERKITIEILSKGKNGNGSLGDDEEKDFLTQKKKANRKLSSMLNETLHPIKSYEKGLEEKINEFFNETGSAMTAQAGKYLIEQAMQTIERATEYAIDRHLNLTEDYLSQNSYKIIKSNYKMASSAISSVAGGAISGAALGGVPGAVIGAVGGALNWGVNTAISQSERYSQYYQQLNAINFNTQYNSKRAGLYDGSRGTES